MKNVWLCSNTAEKHQALPWITNWLWVKSITRLQNGQTASWCFWDRVPVGYPDRYLGRYLPQGQMKKLPSVLGCSKGIVLDSTSHDKYWPTEEGLEENHEDENKSRKHDLCYEKRLKKMRLFSPKKRRLKGNDSSSQTGKRQTKREYK